MAKTKKVQKSYKVYADLKDPNTPHPLHSGDESKIHEWVTSSERHGNKRKAVALIKAKKRRSTKAQAKAVWRKEVQEALPTAITPPKMETWSIIIKMVVSVEPKTTKPQITEVIEEKIGKMWPQKKSKPTNMTLLNDHIEIRKI